MQQDEHRNWETVWNRHAHWLRMVLQARLRSSLDADEVLQDVAVLAWRKREQLVDGNRIEPWLYRIAIRQTLMFWRKKKLDNRTTALNENDRNHEDTGAADPAEWICKKEAHHLVHQAIRKLPAQDREILLLKHVEGWTYHQISDRLGLSYDKVVYRVARATSRMRKILSWQ